MTTPQFLHLSVTQWVLGVCVALLSGFSKTGVPGAGILMVPLMAAIFGGRVSVGALLPLLVMSDCFAVAFYRTHAQWTELRRLIPWVIPGLLSGTVLLKVLGEHRSASDLLNPFIGIVVLLMLAITVLRGRLGDRLVPTSKLGIAVTGYLAGFTTIASNAAGPIMAIYMTATGMSKNRLMGTSAWYFFIFNLVKAPLLLWLTLDNPGNPMFTSDTLAFDAVLAPVVVIGAFLGRFSLHRIPQRGFTNVILILSAVAALKLVFVK